MARKSYIRKEYINGEHRYTVIQEGKRRWSFKEEEFGDYAFKLAEESLRRQRRITNLVTHSNGVTNLLVFSSKYGILKVKIDKEDTDYILEENWRVLTDKTSIRGFRNSKGVVLSRYLLGIPHVSGKITEVVDVIDRDYTNMQKSNLRVIEKSFDNLNINLLKNNTSGATGVYFVEGRRLCVGCIGYKGKRKRKTITYGKKISKQEAFKKVLKWRIEKEEEIKKWGELR